MNKYIPKWEQLAKLQKVKAVRSMYVWLFVVPMIAKILSRIEDVATVTVFGYMFELELVMPFEWKVFYFSALFFAVANLLFLLKCYSLTKDHSSFSEFEAAGKGAFQLDEYAREASIPGENYACEHWGEKLQIAHVQQPFWKLYDQLNIARPIWRMICFCCYLAGFILMAIVLYQNFISVLYLTT